VGGHGKSWACSYFSLKTEIILNSIIVKKNNVAFYFSLEILFLVYINCTKHKVRGFIVIFAYVDIMFFDHIHVLLLLFLIILPCSPFTSPVYPFIVKNLGFFIFILIFLIVSTNEIKHLILLFVGLACY
jgi:hypothetical protein